MTMTKPDPLDIPRYADLLRATGKVFVVIGAGQGIGRHVAHALSQLGGKVVCVGRSAEMTEAVANEVGGVAKLGDAGVRADLERIFQETIREFGRVDGVVDSVGSPLRKAIADYTDEDWKSQFDTGLNHVFLVTQIGGREIAKSGGGSITFIGSIAGTQGSKMQVPYASVKAAMNQFVRTAAVELGPTGVRINVVSPGVTRTPRLMKRLGDEQWQEIEERYPLGRAAFPSDIAGAVLFLTSDLAQHVNAQILTVDGGLTARSPLDGVDFAGERIKKKI
jgi:NAD(P)-dependent dehydrogenase (short-subunit alcohol dehydrogenase family)